MAEYEILLRGLKSTYQANVEADDVDCTTDWLRLVKTNGGVKEIVFAAPKDSVVYAQQPVEKVGRSGSI